jgi:hypothetical protein
MLDPTYALILASLALALLTVMLIPAPSRPPDAEAGIQLALLSAGCLTVIVMGAFALTDHHHESTICGAIAWLLVMPCMWLSRAPRPDGEWYEDEDDGGGGSPSPQRPSDPPAPDDRLPGLQPPMMPPARAGRPAIAPAPVPVMATAASPPVPIVATAVKVQRLLAAQAAERVRAADEVRRLLAATVALRPAQVAAAAAVDPPPVSGSQPMPVHAVQPRRTPRARAEHRSIVHPPAVSAHGRSRFRATARRRSASDASHPALHD